MGSVATFTLFFALLALVAQAFAATTLVLAIGTVARVGSAQRALAALRREVGPSARWLGAGVAATASAGSLYLSEVAGFPPCLLCWYQRFAMYPLVGILALAAAAQGTRLGEGATALAAATAIIGGGISIWHMLIERFPWLEATTACDPANPCSIIWVERFGYLTIPTMALSGFAAILSLLYLSRPSRS